MNRRITSLATALLASAALAACSGEPEEVAAPANDTANTVEVIDEAPFENFAEPEPTPSPTPTPAPIAATPLPDEEQIIDDAESVGMTARVQRDEPVGNTVGPVQ